MEIDVFDLACVFTGITVEILIATLFITKQLNKMALSNEEAVGKITALTTQVGKIGTEVQALKDIIVSQGNVSPEVEAALADLKTTVQEADDLNPDATEETPPAEV